MTALMSWLDLVDETQPYPWAAVPCPTCGETELVGARGAGDLTAFDFVCMNCGAITKIEARP